MTGKNLYTEKEMLSLFREKSLELGRPPTQAEMKEDPLLPNYSTYWRRIGGKKKLCKESGIKFVPVTVFYKFCEDCADDPDTCEQEVKDCMKEGGLYFAGKDPRQSR